MSLIPYFAAVAVHESIRAYQQSIGEEPAPAWADAPEWMQQSTIDGVLWRLANPKAPDSAQHDQWMKQKLAEGWVYGEVKDYDKKTHPCLMPYEDLPIEQRAKDQIFREMVLKLTGYEEAPGTEPEAARAAG